MISESPAPAPEQGVMQVDVVGLSGKVEACVLVGADTNLHGLKELVAEQVGVPAMRQRLLLSGALLRAGAPLAEAGVADKAQVTLVKVPGPKIAVAADWHASIWDVVTGNRLHQLDGHDGDVTSISFSPDGTLALTASFDCMLKIWNLETGECMRTLSGHCDTVTSAVFSRDGALLLTSCVDGAARIWDADSGVCLRTFEGHEQGVWCVTFSADGEKIATGSTDTTSKVWVVGSGECVQRFRGHTGRVRSVQFSADGAYLLTASEDLSARMWNIATELQFMEFPHISHVTAASFSGNGLWVITAAMDNVARVFHIATGEFLFALGDPCLPPAYTSATFGKDDTWVLAAYAGRIRVWDTESRSCLHGFESDWDISQAAVLE